MRPATGSGGPAGFRLALAIYIATSPYKRPSAAATSARRMSTFARACAAELRAWKSRFTVLSIALPFAPSLGAVLVLQVLVGLASGTFYPLALSYSLRSLPPRYTVYAIGPYSMELLSSLSIATPMHAWFMDHLSWRWIFWTSAVLTPIMMLCIHPAIPPPPKRTGPTPEVSWRGFLFISLGLALIEGALEQGERLDWLGSPIIIAMFAGGAFMLVAGAVRRWMKPNPLVNLSFLLQRNILILGGGLFTMRFGLLTILVLVPGYLGAVQGYRPLETGRVLLWLAIPALVMGVCAARLMKWIDSRVVLAIALCMVRRDEEAGCGSSGVRRQRQVGSSAEGSGAGEPAVDRADGELHGRDKGAVCFRISRLVRLGALRGLGARFPRRGSAAVARNANAARRAYDRDGDVRGCREHARGRPPAADGCAPATGCT